MQTIKKIRVCPLCSKGVALAFTIKQLDKVDSTWYHCSCGTHFNENGEINKLAFNKDFKEKYIKGDRIEARHEYLRKLYMPLISELTTGRRFLEIGSTVDWNIKALKEDGWVATGIDLIPNGDITGDFEDFDFKDKRFDFILASDVIQSFNKPVESLFKAVKLLNKDGLMLIITPSTDIIYEAGLKGWGNFNGETDNVYFSKKSMCELLDRMGMEVVSSLNNYSRRFHAWNNMIILAQKRDTGEDNVKA